MEDIKFNHEAKRISTSFGITDKRMKEMYANIETLVKTKDFRKTKKKSIAIEKILKVAKPQNNAEHLLMGMWIADHMNENIHEMIVGAMSVLLQKLGSELGKMTSFEIGEIAEKEISVEFGGDSKDGKKVVN